MKDDKRDTEELREDERSWNASSGRRGSKSEPREELRAGGAGDEDEAEEIRRRAYERYLARGEEPGDEREDWLAAERDVRSARGRGERGTEESGGDRGTR